MSLEEEVEIVEFLYGLLERSYNPEMRIIHSDDPYDSPVIVFNHNGKEYAIAVEEFPPRENQFRQE